jgi:hypothetical protein
MKISGHGEIMIASGGGRRRGDGGGSTITSNIGRSSIRIQ